MTDNSTAFPSKDIFTEKLYSTFKQNSLDGYLDERKADLFYRLAVTLTETNKSLNLTAVTDADGVILKHFADSLIAVGDFPEGAKLIDVGCGGGYPTFPLAIVRPDLNITALDSYSGNTYFQGRNLNPFFYHIKCNRDIAKRVNNGKKKNER